MEKLLKKGHSIIISQFHAIQGYDTTPLDLPLALQQVLDTYISLFERPTRLPPTRGEDDQSIPLLPGSHPPNVRTYRYQFPKNNEIEKIIKEILAIRVIHPCTNPYSSPIVMVLKKEGNMRMCPNFQELNKLTIKHKFHILVLDDLLDELHGS